MEKYLIFLMDKNGRFNNYFKWFPDGKINLYENCITRHLKKNKNKTAIIAIDKNKILKNQKLSGKYLNSY